MPGGQLAQQVLLGRDDRGELPYQAQRGLVLAVGGDLVTACRRLVTQPPVPIGELEQRPVLIRAQRWAGQRNPRPSGRPGSPVAVMHAPISGQRRNMGELTGDQPAGRAAYACTGPTVTASWAGLPLETEPDWSVPPAGATSS
jgi:hypothetical protein